MTWNVLTSLVARTQSGHSRPCRASLSCHVQPHYASHLRSVPTIAPPSRNKGFGLLHWHTDPPCSFPSSSRHGHDSTRNTCTSWAECSFRRPTCLQKTRCRGGDSNRCKNYTSDILLRGRRQPLWRVYPKRHGRPKRGNFFGEWWSFWTKAFLRFWIWKAYFFWLRGTIQGATNFNFFKKLAYWTQLFIKTLAYWTQLYTI